MLKRYRVLVAGNVATLLLDEADAKRLNAQPVEDTKTETTPEETPAKRRGRPSNKAREAAANKAADPEADDSTEE